MSNGEGSCNGGSMRGSMQLSNDAKENALEIRIQENSDAAHMSREEVIHHCNQEMTKLERNHVSVVQHLTEENFSLRKELLRRRICEVITKLEVLVEKEEVDLLRSENQQLRDMIKCLSLQVIEAEVKMSEQSLSEAQLLKTTENLKSTVEDAHIEASIVGVAFSCILKGMMDQIKCIAEESPVEAAHNTQPVSQCEIENLNMEYIIMQELSEFVYKEALKVAEEELIMQGQSELVYKEALKEAEEKIVMQELSELLYKQDLKEAEEELNNLNMKYIDENKLLIWLQMENLEKEKKIEVEIANKERLRQEVFSLAEEKEHLAAALEKEKERYDVTVREIDNLRGGICLQQILISESSKESNAAKTNLNKALEQIERQKADICKLDQKLELARKELREVNEVVEAKERKLKEQLESTGVYIGELLKAVTDFESRVQRDISLQCSRLKSLSSQSHLLKQKANVLVRRGNMDKQSLERKSADLEKAESEVDLLGDEVDTLLSLVEKIYIALDHYSPILQHYPGVTETLKLIRRELSGKTKSTWSARFASNGISSNQ